MPREYGNETFIINAVSKVYAESLRSKIMQEIPHLWVYIYNDNNLWTLTVASEFNGKIKDSIKDSILDLIKEP